MSVRNLLFLHILLQCFIKVAAIKGEKYLPYLPYLKINVLSDLPIQIIYRCLRLIYYLSFKFVITGVFLTELVKMLNYLLYHRA